MKEQIVHILNFLSSHDFLVSFSAELTAGILVAALLALLAYLSGIFNPPKPVLVMVAKQNGTYGDEILFTRKEDGTFVADFQLAIRNDGDLTLKAGEGFWHTYIVTNDAVTPVTAPGELNHQRGLISYSIYPSYIVDLDAPTYRLIIQKDDKPKEGIPYFFATDYGLFPSKTEFNAKTGQVQLKSVGIIKFVLPKNYPFARDASFW